MITRPGRRCQDCQLQQGSRRQLRRHQREAHRPARPPAPTRLAHALRAMHREQIYAMECLMWLLQPAEAVPLTWVRTPCGHQLVGWYLPATIENPRRTSST